MNIIQEIENTLLSEKKDYDFEIGDTVRVHYRIVEGNRERIQMYEGIVIAIDNKGMSKTFTVRKISFDVGVERIFPMYSPKIAKVETVRKGKANRSKLYYLRERKGKSAKLKERRLKAGEKKAKAPIAESAPEGPVVNEAPEETAGEPAAE